MKLYRVQVRTRCITVSAVLLVLINCFAQRKYKYKIPDKLNDGWQVSSLQEEGMDRDPIEVVTNNIIADKFKGIFSYLIVKNGKLVHEEYFKGHGRDEFHEIYSITKSFSSTLIGIAIDRGIIGSVEESVLDLLPQYKKFIKDPGKNDIKLRHILTISTGLEWYERSYSYSDPRNTETQMVETDDWMKFVLTRPLKDEPGTIYNYNTGSVHLLSAIIKSKTGMYAAEFAEKYLFEPLGIKEYYWNKDKMGYHNTGATHGGLRLKPRDLAKFGLMILKKGNWRGKQIVSEKWIKEATSKQIEIYNNINDCGYLWWPGFYQIGSRKINFIASYGYGGQSMYIIPELDLIVIFTAWSSSQDANVGFPVFWTLLAAISKQGYN